MITVKLSNIIDSTEALKALMTKPLKARTAFAVARIAREVEKEYNLFNQSRTELIQKYGEKDENGELKVTEEGNYTVSKDNIAEFNTSFQELLDTEIEINAEPVSMDDLGDVDFTPNEVLNLEAFIKMD